MSQFSALEKEADTLMQRLERDLDMLDQSSTTEDGNIIATFFRDLVIGNINEAMNKIPRGELDVLPGKTIESLGDQIRKEVLGKINVELTAESELQMNEAIELLIKDKGVTAEYLSLLVKIANTRNRLLTVLLMQNL